MAKLHRNQAGIISHLLLVVVALFVLAAAGFGGYRVYRSKHSISAKADSYTQLVAMNGATLLGCRTSSGNIKIYAKNPTNYTATGTIGDGSSSTGVSAAPHTNSATSTMYTIPGSSGRYQSWLRLSSGGSNTAVTRTITGC